MNKGYKFGASICPDCGEEIADNWYVRHRKEKHPVGTAICDAADLYGLWGQLVDLLEAGASIYDEEVDALVDAIEDRFAQFDKSHILR